MVGAILLSFIVPEISYALDVSGVVYYKGTTVTVTNNNFSIDGVSGSIDPSTGNYVLSNGTSGNLLTTCWVTGYKIEWQDYVPVNSMTYCPTEVITKPSGQVYYKGTTINIVNGAFTINVDGKDVSGTIDGTNGNVVLSDGSAANLLKICGITGYRIWDVYTPVDASAYCSKTDNIATYGKVYYNGTTILIENGKFAFSGGITGNIDGKTGDYVLSNGTKWNLLTTCGVTGYQIYGSDLVVVNPTGCPSPKTTLVSWVNRYGNKVNIDINVLAEGLKSSMFGEWVLPDWQVAGYAWSSWLSPADIKEINTFVRTHSVSDIAKRLSELSSEIIVKIDTLRPMASVWIAWRVDVWYLSKGLMERPEAWENVLDYAGISFNNKDLDNAYKWGQEAVTKWLSTLSNDKLEKIQAYFYNAVEIASQKPFFEEGWDDMSGYDPEIGRVVTAKEKDAIARIKFVVSNTIFSSDPAHGILSSIGKTKVDPNGGWIPFAFKEYLTESAIKDYLANPNKWLFAGGSGNRFDWSDGTSTLIGASGSTTITTPKNINTNNSGTWKSIIPTASSGVIMWIKIGTNTTVSTGTVIDFNKSKYKDTNFCWFETRCSPYGTLALSGITLSISQDSFDEGVLTEKDMLELDNWIYQNIESKKNILSPIKYRKLIVDVIKKLTILRYRAKDEVTVSKIKYLNMKVRDIRKLK